MPIMAYVIHTRPFKDNQVLLDLFTRDLGLVRGVWRISKKGVRALPGPFLRYQVELRGRTELKTIQQLESVDVASKLEGKQLYALMYIHELLERLLPLAVPVEELFDLYVWLLRSLATGSAIAPLLRRFELGLFGEIGAGIDFSGTSSGAVIQPSQLYSFDDRFGLRPHYGENPRIKPVIYISGRLILAYASGEWAQTDVQNMARELHRRWLDSLLNGRQIEARKLLPVLAYEGERLFGVPVFR